MPVALSIRGGVGLAVGCSGPAGAGTQMDV